MKHQWIQERETIYCLDVGMLSASIIHADGFSWAINGCMDSGNEKTLWDAKQACHRALESKAADIIHAVRETVLHEIRENDEGPDRLKFERGRKDGYINKPPTEATSSYLIGYSQGRQKLLDKTPADW